ncbi:MAG: hypothetical protein MJ223_02510 [Mycoplasmoidaceae bacterium]|nr:hypothetical protein [Mycoplasmoidaceae bacterium]
MLAKTKKIRIIPAICSTVLALPQKLAAITISFFAATIFAASVITSRAIIITGIATKTYPPQAKHICVELINTLSAIGSQNLPKLDTQLFLLARNPSSQSVMLAITKIIPANKKNKVILATY